MLSNGDDVHPLRKFRCPNPDCRKVFFARVVRENFGNKNNRYGTTVVSCIYCDTALPVKYFKYKPVSG